MQLLESSLKFHDAVMPVCITVQCDLNKSKVNTQRSVPDRNFSHLLHGTILFTFHSIVIKQYALKQHHPKSSLQLFDFGCLLQKFATRFRVAKVNVTYFLECKEHIEHSFFFHLVPRLKFSVL